MEKWSDGIYLLGRYNDLLTGCWLLVHNNKGAILELPPYSRNQISSAYTMRQIALKTGIDIVYLLCSHCHGDHFSPDTLDEFLKFFPKAKLFLQKGFQVFVPGIRSVYYFDTFYQLSLDGEPLFLVHAPKHSPTDTMVIFRGVIFTGDWELCTLQSVHNDVPYSNRLQSIDRMINFVRKYNYRIHKAFAVHANNKLENIDFIAIMEETRLNRKL